MPQMKVNTRFDPSDEFEYQTRLERVNLDTERRHDVDTKHSVSIMDLFAKSVVKKYNSEMTTLACLAIFVSKILTISFTLISLCLLPSLLARKTLWLSSRQMIEKMKMDMI